MKTVATRRAQLESLRLGDQLVGQRKRQGVAGAGVAEPEPTALASLLFVIAL